MSQIKNKKTSTFRILAEVLSEKNYFDINEVENIIEVYFKIWYADFQKETSNNDIVAQRNRILSEKEQIELQKNIIERQLLEAKSRLREGQKVDTSWMARANLAFRIKKMQIVFLQSEMTNLKTIEKKRNIELSVGIDRIFTDMLKDYVCDSIGAEKASILFERIGSEIDKNFVSQNSETLTASWDVKNRK